MSKIGELALCFTTLVNTVSAYDGQRIVCASQITRLILLGAYRERKRRVGLLYSFVSRNMLESR